MEFDGLTGFQKFDKNKKVVVRHKCMLSSFTLDPASCFMDILLFKHFCTQASWWQKEAQKVMVEVLITGRFFIVLWIILQHSGLFF